MANMEQLAVGATELGSEVKITVSLENLPIPAKENLGPNQLLVKVLAAPINPTDGFNLSPPGSDLSKVTSKDGAAVTFPVHAAAKASVAGLIGKKDPLGSECCGRVVATGSSAEAKKLQGKLVSVLTPGMTQYAVASLENPTLLVHNDGANVENAAAALVNPVTLCGFVDTMRKEGHTGLVHTAAASNLGKMLLKMCLKEKIPIVCIVRKDSQVAELQKLGAEHALNSTAPDFMQSLIKALVATKATCAFDAIGGGELVSQILVAMERALAQDPKNFKGPKKYGTSVMKKVYVYGLLNPSKLQLTFGFGLTWGVGGFLLANWFFPLPPAEKKKWLDYVRDNLDELFSSHYGKKGTFQELLTTDNFLSAVKPATGEKFLLLPHGVPGLSE